MNTENLLQSIKKDVDDIFYTISLIGDCCDDIKRTESIVKTDNLIKRIESINMELRVDAVKNSKFKNGEKVVVSITKSAVKPTVCFIGSCDVSSTGDINYTFNRVKADGNISKNRIRFYTGWNGGKLIIERYDEKIHGELKNK